MTCCCCLWVKRVLGAGGGCCCCLGWIKRLVAKCQNDCRERCRREETLDHEGSTNGEVGKEEEEEPLLGDEKHGKLEEIEEEEVEEEFLDAVENVGEPPPSKGHPEFEEIHVSSPEQNLYILCTPCRELEDNDGDGDGSGGSGGSGSDDGSVKRKESSESSEKEQDDKGGYITVRVSFISLLQVSLRFSHKLTSPSITWLSYANYKWFSSKSYSIYYSLPYRLKKVGRN